MCINPLAPEVKPSAWWQPAEILLPGILNFNAYSLKKKSYLIDFSFKFNETEFCILLMNWLMRGKCSPIFIINLGL
jgi:hypothetical protein